MSLTRSPGSLTARSPSSNSIQKPAGFFFFGLLLALVAPVFLVGLGSYGMLDPTDSFFVEGPKEMLERSNFLTPLFNYVDWFDKPAFPFLLTVLNYKLFGISAWSARLSSALSGILLVLYTAFVVRRIMGTRAAWICALVLAACPIYVIVGRCALTDEPLTLFIGASLLSFAYGLLRKNAMASLWGYVALSLAMVCKGPIGLVLVAATLTLFAGLEWWHNGRQWTTLQDYPSSLKPWLGVVICLVLVCPYYVAAHFATNGAFTNEFFFHQNLGRFEGTVNHQQPIWWYVPVFLGGFFPWTLFLIGSALYLKRIWPKKLWNRRQRLAVFAFAWLSVVFILFTLVPTKLPTYIVPLSPAVAILVGIYLDDIVRRQNKRLINGLAISILVLAFAPLALLPWLGAKVPMSAPILIATTLVLVIFSVLQMRRVRQGKLREAMTGQILCVLLMLIAVVPIGFRYYYVTHQKPIDNLVGLAKNKNATMATLFNSVPSAIFAFDHRIEMLQSLQEVEKFAHQGPSPHWLLATQNCELMPALHVKDRLIAHEGKWYLLSVEDFSLPKTTTK